MASAVIHLAVAKKVAEKLNIDSEDYTIGSIAPDCAKIVGIPRCVTHYTESDLSNPSPNISKFINKYKKVINNPFELGFYVHLLTDKIWFEEFLPNFKKNNWVVVDKEGTEIILDGVTANDLIYNDYSNVNFELIKYYDLDIGFVYKTDKFPKSHIDEFKDDYFKPLVEKMYDITTVSSDYNYLFNIEKITHFVEYAAIFVIDELNKIKGEEYE